MKRRENLRAGVYLENGKQSMRQPIHFWKALSELYNFDFYENVRNRKFIADNCSLKIFILFFKIFKLQLSAINFRFLTFSCYHVVELEKIFPKMYGLSRFRDKRKNTRAR